MLHIIMYRSACRALLLVFGKACDNYMPWDLTAQKPSIRSFRLAKSERSKLSTYEKREPTFRHESISTIRFLDQKGERNIREYVYVRFSLSRLEFFQTRQSISACNAARYQHEYRKRTGTEERHAWPSQCKHIDCFRPSFWLPFSIRTKCLFQFVRVSMHAYTYHEHAIQYSVQWVSEQNYYGSENWRKIENIAETIWEIFEERF